MHNIIMAMYYTMEFRDFMWIQQNFPKLKTTSGSVKLIATLISLNTSDSMFS